MSSDSKIEDKRGKLGIFSKPTVQDNQSHDEEEQQDNVIFETGIERIKRNMKEQPLVPAGMFLTTFALVAATIGMHRGNARMFQQMLRLRVAAQGFTVVAVAFGGVAYRQQLAKSNEKFEAENSTKIPNS
ncbi:1510_t:CDS:2 [Ambispora gerdemannii]|uniref:1510_t:CDS:1 n=1 Tax=Ambispora gerdemannii TaxID=144530 RepID=A0A9N9BUP4_9GLOM|nr:1510_t:CDS:2 [Ambispora gerdemannii]